MRYLTSERKTDYWALTDMDTVRLNAPSVTRPDVQKPIWHVALSLPAGEYLDTEKWREVVANFMQRLGLDGHEWAAIVHNETDHQHAHIVANRLDYAGKLWRGEFDGKRAIAAAKDLEVMYNLTQEEFNPKKGRATLTRNEIEMALRLETQPPRLTLQEIIDQAVHDKPSTSTFLQRLEQNGVDILANMSPTTGRIAGLAFSYDGIAFKGSRLGKAYAWSKLQQRIDYDQTRDREAIQKRSGNRAGSHATSASARGQDGSGNAGHGRSDDRNHNRNARQLPESGQSGTSRSAGCAGICEAGRCGSTNVGAISEPTAIGSSKIALKSKPLSRIAGSRGPVRDSRVRLSALASTLLARAIENSKSRETPETITPNPAITIPIRKGGRELNR